MKTMNILMLCIGLAGGALVMWLSFPSPPEQSKPQPQVSTGDVTDLINRLKPLAERPDEDWRGVSVTVTGASATVDIKTKDGNEYRGKGRTLPDAVRMIDSTRIRDALNGWKPQVQ